MFILNGENHTSSRHTFYANGGMTEARIRELFAEHKNVCKHSVYIFIQAYFNAGMQHRLDDCMGTYL